MLKEAWKALSTGLKNLVDTEYGVISPASEAVNQRYCEIDDEVKKQKVDQNPEYNLGS